MTRFSRCFAVVLCLFLILPLLPSVVYADTGPKPSVRVQFTGLGDAECYATLLSKHASTGPESAWNGEEELANPNHLPEEIWRAFVDHADPDGYYFLYVCGGEQSPYAEEDIQRLAKTKVKAWLAEHE